MSDEYHTPEGEYVRRRLDRRWAQREADAAGWFSRKRAIAQLRELEANDGLEEAARSWARELLCSKIQEAWEQISPHPNWRHPQLLDHLPKLAEEAAAAAIKETPDDPLLRGMLTAAAAERLARENVDAVRQVVDDPTIYVQHTTIDGSDVTVLQHAASGLRGQFTVDRIDGFGTVLSKPFRIPSINPDAPHDDGNGWEPYVGLGIGRRLYLAAVEFHPHVRWRIDYVSPSAASLRSKLHGADPYRWAGMHCAWCEGQLIDWRTTDSASLEQHPIVPAPVAIPPRIIEISPRERGS